MSVDQFNCCVWCLMRGSKRVENLKHVMFDCPEYDPARRNPRIQEMLKGGVDVLELHRNRWSRRQLKDAVVFFLDVLSLRAKASGRRKVKASELQAIADFNWFD